MFPASRTAALRRPISVVDDEVSEFSNGNPTPTPLPCDDHGASTLFISGCACGDVVEPPVAARFVVHPDGDRQIVDALCDRTGTFDGDRRSHAVRNKVQERATSIDARPAPEATASDPEHRVGGVVTKDALRQLDHFDREVTRARTQRERLERRDDRRAKSRSQRGRRTARGARNVDVTLEHVDRCPITMPVDQFHGGQPNGDCWCAALPTPTHLDESRGFGHVATHASALKRFATGPLHGVALATYFFLLPFVVVAKWRLAEAQSNGLLIRALLVGLGLFWLLFLYQVGRNVVRLRQGHLLGVSGSVWLAGLVVALLSLWPSSGVAGTSSPSLSLATTAITRPHVDLSPRARAAKVDDGLGAATSTGPMSRDHSVSANLSALSSLPLALLAKRRSDMLRATPEELSDDEIDETVELLHGADPILLAQLVNLVGDRRDGVVRVTSDFGYGAITSSTDPLAVCVIDDDDDVVVLSFAREGGRLRVPTAWSRDDILASVVALHERGRLRVASNELDLLRLLATRALRSTLVLYLGPADEITDDLRACAVTIERMAFVSDVGPTPSSSSFVSLRDSPPGASLLENEPAQTRVELLRAAPHIAGLCEPFTAPLRRRCVEMVAYLALHRHEPVTGDRLRTRVLTHADVDASLRTLANTASAVRRSLGGDAAGPRLHPVTSSGLYVTHSLTSDVEIFHVLVTRARQLPLDQAAPLTREALQLVHGEPLASALRGFEWFLVEGYWARLQRDGEWAALALHQWALENDDFELAFWALERGRLIDPFNDALSDALARVPRLRQFGRDGPGRTQHQSIGPRDAVVAGGPSNRFAH